MSKRIGTELPQESFDIVSEAARLSGMTIKSFAASAILNTALDVVERLHKEKNSLSRNDPEIVLGVKPRSPLSEDEQAEEILRILSGPDDGAAAKAHLAAGRPIFYIDGTEPKGKITKEYPDGRKEFV